MKKILLSLDMSTTCTGWSTFDIETKKLLDYGIFKPKVPLVTKMKYPEKQLKVCVNMADQIGDLIENTDYDFIVIEEINRHMNRMAGKTLDILHGFVWQEIYLRDTLDLVYYMDSDGKDGWRSRKCLSLLLSDADRQHNKEAKKLNKSMGKGHKKIPIINKKHLAARYVNRAYGTNFDVDERKTDSDLADSIGLGHAFLHYRLQDSYKVK